MKSLLMLLISACFAIPAFALEENCDMNVTLSNIKVITRDRAETTSSVLTARVKINSSAPVAGSADSLNCNRWVGKSIQAKKIVVRTEQVETVRMNPTIDVLYTRDDKSAEKETFLYSGG